MILIFLSLKVAYKNEFLGLCCNPVFAKVKITKVFSYKVVSKIYEIHFI